jgi:2,4-dienoyl-CoA reductase-like NADH-dependent reductase (Old Yellow Enzyme family)
LVYTDFLGSCSFGDPCDDFYSIIKAQALTKSKKKIVLSKIMTFFNRNLTMTTLFEPLKIGCLTVPNRIMAPLTPMRSKQPGNAPQEINAKYYTQCASAGLIISEATQISPQGQGYLGTPSIYSPEQVKAWKLVSGAVHKARGRIFLQLWHVERTSHASHQPDGALPVDPAAIAAENSGTHIICNPDLPERIRQSSLLTPYDRATFYGGDTKGYIDYLPLNEKVA